MKKLISIISIFSILINSAGLITYYYVQKSNIKSGFKNYIRNSKVLEGIETFVFKKNDTSFNSLYWLDDHEFLLNGKMYDVVKINYKKDFIEIKCINDRKEEELKEKYNNLTTENQHASNNLKNTVRSLVKLLQIDYYFNNSGLNIPCNYSIIPELFSFYLYYTYHEVLSPPPESHITNI